MSFLLCIWLCGSGFITLLGLVLIIFSGSDERGEPLVMFLIGLISSLVCIGEICFHKNSKKENIPVATECTTTTIEPMTESSVIAKEFSAADYSLELKITSFQGKQDTVYVIVPKNKIN